MKIGYDYVGVSTAMFCHDGKGNFLMQKRSDKCRDEHHTWDCGGGGLEFDLTVEQNVLAELREEYGCTGTIEEALPPHDAFRVFEGKKTHWVIVPFFILVDPEKVKIGEPDKIEEIGWFRMGAFPEPLHTGFAHAFEVCKKYFEKYLGEK